MPALATPPSILTIPVELVQHILVECSVWDVVAFSSTCRSAYGLVHHPADQELWRQLFLRHPFDDPRRAFRPHLSGYDESAIEVDWKHEIIRRVQAKSVAFGRLCEAHERKCALWTFVEMVEEAPPVDPSRRKWRSNNLTWLRDVLEESSLLQSTPMPDESGLFSRLRSYLALSLEKKNKDKESQNRLRERRNKSRCYVYDLRNYNSENHWGPYTTDGQVNWVHVEHMINVVLMNLDELPGPWTYTRPPLGLEATRPFSAPGSPSPEDWAGIEGTWRRYVCFMDYRDLFAFNFTDVGSGRYDPTFFDDLRFREATRLIEIKLQIIPKKSLRYCIPPDTRSSGPNMEYPPLFFTGSAKGVTRNTSVVEGMVSMGMDGIVKWQFVSVWDENTQWRVYRLVE
ncbi:hypothetical protein AX16_002576 [Volvariella volvacea WC 439]|nr:hypothetical protein AX16_002576 [Volvariella volvacea WC 439]